MSRELILNKIENNFNHSINKSIQQYCLNESNKEIQMFQESFQNSLLNLRSKNENASDRARIGYFPVAGDPIHWAHLLTAFKILADYNLDKIVLISGGYDPSKPNLVHPDIRFPMIKKALKIFEGLIVLSNITLNPEYALQKGENNIFNILAKHSSKRIDAYYIVGSDHYNWTTIDKNGIEHDDTLKILSDNMERNDFNKELHTITTIFIRRTEVINTPPLNEYQSSSRHIPFFNIRFNIPDFAYSSTQIRNGFKKSDFDESVVYIPAKIYPIILQNNLYK